eukprot:5702175-Amphidinium_carterae.1
MHSSVSGWQCQWKTLLWLSTELNAGRVVKPCAPQNLQISQKSVGVPHGCGHFALLAECVGGPSNRHESSIHAVLYILQLKPSSLHQHMNDLDSFFHEQGTLLRLPDVSGTRHIDKFAVQALQAQTHRAATCRHVRQGQQKPRDCGATTCGTFLDACSMMRLEPCPFAMGH